MEIKGGGRLIASIRHLMLFCPAGTPTDSAGEEKSSDQVHVGGQANTQPASRLTADF